jgi:integrase
MATTPTPPRLHAHHGAKSWTSYWRDDDGKLRAKRFGKEAEISKRAALAKYQFWLDTEWKAKGHVRNPDGDATRFTVARLAGRYLRHAHKTFRKHGRTTSQVTQVRYAMRALRACHGDRMAETMESPDLAMVRDWMIQGEKVVRRRRADGTTAEVRETYTRSLTTVNGRLLIMKEAFEWAREKGWVPRLVVLDLQTVKPLQRGRSEAKDPGEVPPIDRSVVDATLPHCSSVVRAMIEVNLYTGARPGEVCIMRGCDLEMVSDDCWIYSPSEYKTEHKGGNKPLKRKIAMGPRAIAAVRPFLIPDTRAFLFSPAAARAELDARRREEYAAARAEKGAKQYPSQLARIQAKPVEERGRWAGSCYSEESYRRAIHHACRKASIEPWNPNQLRHTHGTEVRRVFGLAALQDAGLEAAKETLGHSDSRTSEIYAKEGLERAMLIARRVG